VPKAAVLVQLFFFSLRNARPWLGVWDVRGAEHVFFFVTRTYLVNLIFIFCTHKTHYGYVNTYDMIKKFVSSIVYYCYVVFVKPAFLTASEQSICHLRLKSMFGDLLIYR
jgi:hypothetical protein